MIALSYVIKQVYSYGKMLNVRDKLASLPTSPGVYQMKDASGQILYVGKAKNLKNRVRSYFQDEDGKDPKTRLLVSHIVDFEIIVTNSEMEALVLENTLIKKYRPKYNVRFRDDKTYPYIKMDMNADFPRLELTRKPVRGKNIKYFGPFAKGSVYDLIKLLSHQFQLRDCVDNKFRNRSRPCLSYQMGNCTAPCVEYVNQQKYREQVNMALRVLEGKGQKLIAELNSKMESHAEKMEYEQAALYRDQIANIDHIAEEQRVANLAGNKDRDVVGIFFDEEFIALSVLFIRAGAVSDKKSFVQPKGLATIEEILDQFIVQFYIKHPIPDEILLPLLPDSSASALSELIGSAREEYTGLKFFVPAQGGELAEIISMASQNAKADLEEYYNRVRLSEDDLLNLKKELDLAKKPARIECFDISTFQGDNNVASRSVFIDGKPSPENYRRYKITTVDGTDDFACMREVLSRRFQNSQDQWPDLVVIDGGKGQLAMARQIFDELGIENLPFVGLAKARVEGRFAESKIKRKSERVFIPNRVNPVILKEGTGAYRIMTQIRDEAHRFAINYHRKLRDTLPE